MTISAKVILDSVFRWGPSSKESRITTLQLRYPRFIHSEFMTHRVFSRNAASSRAIPVKRIIQDILDDTAMPIHWGKNISGMQAKEEHYELVSGHIDYEVNIGDSDWEMDRRNAWLLARDYAIMMAMSFDKAEYHKQIVNRILEPYVHMNTLVTSTEWENFFDLRCHPDAQPEFQELAKCIRSAMQSSTPGLIGPGQWHTPYVSYDDFFRTEHDHPRNTSTAIKISVARCARVSYLTQEGKQPTIEEDLKLYDRLVGSVPLHASPAEHQATPDQWLGAGFGDRGWKHPELHGNFVGFKQYRKYLEYGKDLY